jgi:hypothetical protein
MGGAQFGDRALARGRPIWPTPMGPNWYRKGLRLAGSR